MTDRDAGQMPETEILRIEPRHGEEGHVVKLAGELDLSSAGAFTQAVLDLGERGAGDVLVDLSELTFVDSTGLRAILSAKAIADEQGWRLQMTEGTRQVERLFELTGVRHHMPIAPAPKPA